MRTETYELSLTTQGPTYPPSEVMNEDGDFVVIGRINRPGPDGSVRSEWGSAIVSPDSEVPPHGAQRPYRIVRELPVDPAGLTAADRDMVLYTLPLPLPCNNYPMLFAPDQCPQAHRVRRPSHPFHEVPIPDLRPEDGRKVREPVTLGQWVRAQGFLEVATLPGGHDAEFRFEFSGLVPDSMYTVMSLREHDLSPAPRGPFRPGPLGVPNVFLADPAGKGHYRATLPNPFPAPGAPGPRRIVNVVLLWMSYQQNYGGAIGFFGLGGDIHAQLKLREASFQEFVTTAR
ncbi:hypothetical protein QWJ26_13970 [Streptomyces sp. CSDS2]|uniref:hypothetical protein n=1 Tax=Streptomyces sp. CSDS2 TaxID=3055051 RepID=UPI0025AFFBB4|nr:hypothetical protein [Streptomyces sp. CSDS2]MDN3260898.1 hypothetical protein [Streptomyces sp. CSDS2]